MGKRRSYSRNHLKCSFYRNRKKNEDSGNNNNNNNNSDEIVIISDNEFENEEQSKYTYERIGIGFTKEEM